MDPKVLPDHELERTMLVKVTLAAAITSIVLAFVVFGPAGRKLGMVDDVAFLAAAVLFLYTFVRLIGHRVSDVMHAEQRSERQKLRGDRRDR